MDARIFVAIASYCDPELPRTLDDCLSSARYPEALRFGICWQYDENVPVDLSRFRGDKRFRFSEHPIRESNGGSWARNIAQGLWDGEPYSLQVDSHMAFARYWDVELIRMMQTFPADKPLITMIAPLFRIGQDNELRRQTDKGIRASRVADWSAESGWSPWLDWGLVGNARFVRNRFLSGGFVFSPGRWNEDVRQDPDHYYWGEEFALTLRSFTHGYDMFLPDLIPVWHMEHTKAPPRRHWENGREVVDAKNRIAFDRLRKLAYSGEGTSEPSLGRYGLGRTRTLAEYERFAGLDLVNKRAHPDVFSGLPPDPVTIRDESDWAQCVTIERFRQLAGGDLRAPPQQS